MLTASIQRAFRVTQETAHLAQAHKQVIQATCILFLLILGCCLSLLSFCSIAAGTFRACKAWFSECTPSDMSHRDWAYPPIILTVRKTITQMHSRNFPANTSFWQ